MENRTTGVMLLRLFFGLALLKDFITFFNNRNFLFDKKGIVSYETYQDLIDYYGLHWLNIDFTSPSTSAIFCIVGMIFSLLFTLGIFSRTSAIALFFMLFIFKFRNIFLLDGGDNIITALLPFFFFIQSKSVCSSYNKQMDNWGINQNYYVIQLHKLAVLAILIQVCIIYLFAGLHKLQGEVWLNGTALYYILNSSDFSPYSFGKLLSSYPIFVYFSTWFTLVFQLVFPVLVWFTRTRKIVLLLGIVLHLGIFILMRIDNFSFIMLACYTVFFTDDEYDSLKLKTNLFYKNIIRTQL